QAVDYSAAFELLNVFCEPRQSLSLAGEHYVLKPQGSACQWTSQDNQLRTKLLLNVGYNAVIGGRGRAQHRHPRRQTFHHANDAPVVRSEVVSPIRYAMNF